MDEIKICKSCLEKGIKFENTNRKQIILCIHTYNDLKAKFRK